MRPAVAGARSVVLRSSVAVMAVRLLRTGWYYLYFQHTALADDGTSTVSHARASVPSGGGHEAVRRRRWPRSEQGALLPRRSCSSRIAVRAARRGSPVL